MRKKLEGKEVCSVGISRFEMGIASMKTQTLNGIWSYRIGKGTEQSVTVPFSRLPVGHSECMRQFDLEQMSERVLLKFDGITYHAKVFLNDALVGEMGPYCEYTFDVTDIVREKNNTLLVELEDISPAFGPTAGWENYGGIIRDVSLLYHGENYITDVFFHSKLLNGYRDAEFTVETTASTGAGEFYIALYDAAQCVMEYHQSTGEAYAVKTLRDVGLWSPESPKLYELRVALRCGEQILDTYSCQIGFREFTCNRHRFLLNGEPLFLKGVCKHEMFGDSGHCPTEEQMLIDMRMIKETGCNFVRLVHYPHNKKILEIADRLGLMVSEEPGLWWSDTSKPEVASGSLEVLRRTILRDRNHASIVFWLSFNECRFTEQYLIDSANTCRKHDPTRMVSGANCMSNEDTLKYFNLCGFDFYTMHPYDQTIDRAKESAHILNDKPLLFTEWGGHFVYDNPKLLGEFMDEMHRLYLADSDEGALAGAFFWEWSELNDFNRGQPACIDGLLHEGLVDPNRKPRLIYNAFCEALKRMEQPREDVFWIDSQVCCDGDFLRLGIETVPFAEALRQCNEAEKESGKLRIRNLRHGPVLKGAPPLCEVPLLIKDQANFSFACDWQAEFLSVYGMASLVKGYPLGGDYGESVATMTVTYADASKDSFVWHNGIEITTVFALHNSSRIDPIAEKAERIARFGYEKNFEQYVLNRAVFRVDPAKKIREISVASANNGYAILVYGIEAK